MLAGYGSSDDNEETRLGPFHIRDSQEEYRKSTGGDDVFGSNRYPSKTLEANRGSRDKS